MGLVPYGFCYITYIHSQTLSHEAEHFLLPSKTLIESSIECLNFGSFNFVSSMS
jgi:hypothetical protein